MGESWNEGVRCTQVPVLINTVATTTRCVAGPWSGKTFGLVRRVERIPQYLYRIDRGDRRYVGLPVFPLRNFLRTPGS